MCCFCWSAATSAACTGNGHTSVALGDHQSLETFFSFLFSLQLISDKRSWPDVVMADLRIPAQPFPVQEGCGSLYFQYCLLRASV